MKNNQLTGVFVALLFLSAMASILFLCNYNSARHKLQRLTPRVMEINRVTSLVQAILNDTIEYDRATKNPEMTRLLQSLGKTNAPAAAKPPTK